MSEIDDTTGQVPIAFRGTELYRKRLQNEALNRGIKVKGLIETAVELYLKSHPVPISEQIGESSSKTGETVVSCQPSVVPGTLQKGDSLYAHLSGVRKKWHEYLDVALDSDDTDTLRAVKSNLELFFRITQEQIKRDAKLTRGRVRKRRTFEQREADTQSDSYSTTDPK